MDSIPAHRRKGIFHPLFVLGVALLAAAVFGLFAVWRYDGEFQSLLLSYHLPVGVPFVVFLFDRLEQHPHRRFAHWAIDMLILGLLLARAIAPVPFISGHALFLTYALLTTQTTIARITATLILLQVGYLKLIVWQDTTFFGGVFVGVAASLIYRRIRRNASNL